MLQTVLSEASQASPVCPSGKSNVWVKISVEHWWDDTDRVKPKHSVQNLPHCHFVTTNFTQTDHEVRHRHRHNMIPTIDLTIISLDIAW